VVEGEQRYRACSGQPSRSVTRARSGRPSNFVTSVAGLPLPRSESTASQLAVAGGRQCHCRGDGWTPERPSDEFDRRQPPAHLCTGLRSLFDQPGICAAATMPVECRCPGQSWWGGGRERERERERESHAACRAATHAARRVPHSHAACRAQHAAQHTPRAARRAPYGARRRQHAACRVGPWARQTEHRWRGGGEGGEGGRCKAWSSSPGLAVAGP
jgi:hypothetical protein